MRKKYKLTGEYGSAYLPSGKGFTGEVATSPNGREVLLVPTNRYFYSHCCGGSRPHLVLEVRSLRDGRKLREICSVCDVE